jgi:hypothetical protein
VSTSRTHVAARASLRLEDRRVHGSVRVDLGRIARTVGSVALLLLGSLFGLYGAFTLLYGGEEGSSGDEVAVNLGGRDYDANLVGVVALGIALLLTIPAVLLLRRR